MDLQTIIAWSIGALALLYALRTLWRQFIAPDQESINCACGSKQGCAALNQDFDELLKALDQIAPTPADKSSS